MSNRPDPVHREIAREDFTVYFEDAKLRLGHAIGLGQSALRSIFLVNGGGILALLTIIGNSEVDTEPRALFWSFVWFAMAMLTNLISSIFFALSQMFYMQSSNEEGWRAQAAYHGTKYAKDGTRDDFIGDRLITFTISLAITSLILFLVASFVALDAIT